MNSKKKLIISMLLVSFVLLSAVATVAIAFALTQQTIKTSVNISFVAEDIDGTATATFTIGGVEENLIAMKGTQVLGENLVFKASDTEDAGNLMFPEDALALTSQNDNVVIQYTYSNTGAKHYIASMDFAANIEADNMKVEYSIDGTTYSEQRYAVVVPANTSNKSYWIKISIIDKAKNASFTGDFNWLLNGCDEQADDYLTIASAEFQAVEGQTGAYAVSINGEGGYLPQVVYPSVVNGDPVTTIAQSSNLTQAQKNQVTSVYVPDSVTTIGTSAFEGCANLKTITFEQNEAAGASAQINSGLTTIQGNAFKNCSKLNNLVIPSTVTECGEGELWDDSFESPFVGCTNLKNITTHTLNESVVSAIKELANTNGGMNLIIGDSVTSIESGRFSYCRGLTSITIPNSVTSIETGAFYTCGGLQSITVKNGNTKYHSAGNCLIETASKILIAGCNTSVIPTDGSVTSISEGAFSECSGIKTMVIPYGVISIGHYAFESCVGLTDVVIASSVTSIGDIVFNGCVNLTSITFENPNGWVAYKIIYEEEFEEIEEIGHFDLTDPANAATLLTSTYTWNSWKRS